MREEGWLFRTLVILLSTLIGCFLTNANLTTDEIKKFQRGTIKKERANAFFRFLSAGVRLVLFSYTGPAMEGSACFIAASEGVVTLVPGRERRGARLCPARATAAILAKRREKKEEF